MSLAWHDLIGTLGVVVILVAYFLLQTERIDIYGWFYSVTNLLGSLLITVSLIYTFNFPSFVIEVFWIAISLIGIVRYFRQRGNPKAAPGS